jgi:hypothetical protein
MITLACLFTLLFIWVNYKMIKATRKNEKFDPLNHGVIFWLIWFWWVILAVIGLIALCITFLP